MPIHHRVGVSPPKEVPVRALLRAPPARAQVRRVRLQAGLTERRRLTLTKWSACWYSL